MAEQQDITADDEWFKSEDKTIRFIVMDSTGVNPQDITGYTLQWKLKDSQGGSTLLTKTPTLTTPTSGIADVAIASADTAGLALTVSTQYWYTLWRTDATHNSLLAFGNAYLQVV